jgi:hypothetical protein
MLTDTSRIVVAKDQVSSDLAGEVAILSLKNRMYYGLNQVGARVWHLIQKPITFAELVQQMMSAFEVDRPRLEQDLRDLVKQLAEQQLVEIME